MERRTDDSTGDGTVSVTSSVGVCSAVGEWTSLLCASRSESPSAVALALPVADTVPSSPLGQRDATSNEHGGIAAGGAAES